jgi:hypothetical protein
MLELASGEQVTTRAQAFDYFSKFRSGRKNLFDIYLQLQLRVLLMLLYLSASHQDSYVYIMQQDAPHKDKIQKWSNVRSQL